MTKLAINAKSSALLVLDYSVRFVNTLAPSEKEKVLGNLTRAIRAARMARVLVIYVVVKFRKGYPEVSPNNVLFNAVKEGGRLQEDATDIEICKEIAPQPGDIVVTKKRVSAFAGNDLDIILRSNHIDTLVLAGSSSSGVTESTARYAFDLDYRLFVLGDCCSDRTPEDNNIALTWLLPRFNIATVCATDEFIKAIS